MMLARQKGSATDQLGQTGLEPLRLVLLDTIFDFESKGRRRGTTLTLPVLYCGILCNCLHLSWCDHHQYAFASEQQLLIM